MEKPRYDAVVSLFGGYRKPKPGEPFDCLRHISHETKVNVIGTGALVRDLVDASYVIFSGGGHKRYAERPVGSLCMREYLLAYFADAIGEADGQIPEEHILYEGRSDSTETNALFTKDLVEQCNLRNLALVANGFHIPRVVEDFARVGIAFADTYAAEELATLVVPQYIEAYRHSRELRFLEAREIPLRIANHYEPTRRLMQSATGFVRSGRI